MYHFTTPQNPAVGNARNEKGPVEAGHSANFVSRSSRSDILPEIRTWRPELAYPIGSFANPATFLGARSFGQSPREAASWSR